MISLARKMEPALDKMAEYYNDKFIDKVTEGPIKSNFYFDPLVNDNQECGFKHKYSTYNKGRNSKSKIKKSNNKSRKNKIKNQRKARRKQRINK